MNKRQMNSTTLEKPMTKAGTLYLVHVLTHATRTRLDEQMASLGLSSFQYTILSVIARHEGLSSSKLSRRFHVTPPAMGEVILLLERKGLITRREDPANRKILRLSLTPQGMAVAEQGDAIVAAFEKRVFSGLTDPQIESLRDILTKSLATVQDIPR
jgi:DNA-binding MarR family transcriptional regulator